MKFSDPSNPKNERLLAFARFTMGSKVGVNDASRDFGRPSIVWRLSGSDGLRAWLKHHESGTQYRRERLGLEVIVPALAENGWWSSPELISKDDELEAVLMTEVEGEVLATASVSDDERKEMYRLAGRFSQMLHAVDLDAPDGVDSVSHLRAGLERYLDVGLPHVDGCIDTWVLASRLECNCVSSLKSQTAATSLSGGVERTDSTSMSSRSRTCRDFGLRRRSSGKFGLGGRVVGNEVAGDEPVAEFDQGDVLPRREVAIDSGRLWTKRCRSPGNLRGWSAFRSLGSWAVALAAHAAA